MLSEALFAAARWLVRTIIATRIDSAIISLIVVSISSFSTSTARKSASAMTVQSSVSALLASTYFIISSEIAIFNFTLDLEKSITIPKICATVPFMFAPAKREGKYGRRVVSIGDVENLE